MSRRRHTPEQIITALREKVDQALPRPRSIHSSEDLEGRGKKRGKPQQPQEPMAQPAR